MGAPLNEQTQNSGVKHSYSTKK